jgi:CheY-like chemotaxis protein
MRQEDSPELLIVDWIMPGMDGPELCRRLRSRSMKALYIILLTSKSNHRDVVQGLEAGADDFVSKPYNKDELRARVNAGRRILELQAQLRQDEKLQGVLEMAGAVCHELNQPLQAMNNYSELLLMTDPGKDDSVNDMLKNIQACVSRIGDLTRRIMKISQYETKRYISSDRKIVDIGNASTESEGNGGGGR